MKKIIVFDIGGSSIKWSIIKESGEFIESNKFNVPSNKDGFFYELSKVTNEMKEKHEVQGIAISAPGAVNSETGIIGGASAIP